MKNALLSGCRILIFTASFTLLACNTAQPQKEISQEQTSPVKAAVADFGDKNLVGFACYEGGEETETVALFSSMLERQDYKSLKEKLFSPMPAERYLATVVCNQLLLEKRTALTESEQSKIRSNTGDQSEFEVCSGCDGDTKTTAYNLFAHKEEPFSQEATRWVNKEMLLN